MASCTSLCVNSSTKEDFPAGDTNIQSEKDVPGVSLEIDSHRRVCYNQNRDEFCVQNQSLTSVEIKYPESISESQRMHR